MGIFSLASGSQVSLPMILYHSVWADKITPVHRSDFGFNRIASDMFMPESKAQGGLSDAEMGICAQKKYIGVGLVLPRSVHLLKCISH